MNNNMDNLISLPWKSSIESFFKNAQQGHLLNVATHLVIDLSFYPIDKFHCADHRCKDSDVFCEHGSS